MIFFAVAGIVEIGYAMKKLLGQPEGLRKFLGISLVVYFLFVVATILLAINPIYKVVSEIGNSQTTCTLEAKVCPDGSSVVRTGPKCEFAPCPSSQAPQGKPIDPTANWKTFKNSYGSFSLKLPEDMKAIGVGIGPPKAEEANEVIICEGCDQSVDPSNTPLIELRITELKDTVYKNTPPPEIARQNYESNIANKNNTKSVIRDFQEITFSGETAYTYALNSSGYSGKYEGFVMPSGTNKVTEIERNGFYYLIVHPENPVFDQILSTFKFTDDQTIDASNWKTYANINGGYSLKHPADYKIMENQKGSVDGVIINVPNTTTLISPVLPSLNTNLQISIHYENATKGLTAQQFAQQEGITTKSNSYVLDGNNGFIFENTPIGPFPSSIIYIFAKNKAYTVTIETSGSYEDVKIFVDQILSTFRFTN